jgi:uncharacterized membrane protein
LTSGVSVAAVIYMYTMSVEIAYLTITFALLHHQMPMLVVLWTRTRSFSVSINIARLAKLCLILA